MNVNMGRFLLNKELCRGWIYPVLTIRTEDIYLAAGLDAVVMLKTIEYGVQLFVPLAVVCLAVRTFSSFL